MDTITTRTVGTGFAEIGESVLTETTQTAIVFKPQMHEGGIRGSIIRYKKGRNGDRETPVPVDFRRLNAGDGIEIELNTEAVTNLTQRIQEIQALLDEEGVRLGIHRYRVTNVNDLVITDQNKARIIQRLLEANLGEDIWNQLVQDNPNIATRLANAKIQEDRFTPPPEDLALRETVRKLERRICEAAAHFVPVNRPIWDALFPDWEAVQPTLDLIVDYPEPYDAVAAHSPGGQAHLIFDLIRWCNYAELDQLDSIIRNLLTHEITHLLIGHRYPAADAALESTDYLTRLDAYTFHEGFAHLLSYQATEIDCVDWHTPELTEVAAASRAKLRLALTETDPDRQKQFLEEAVCGSYYEKFACMCGMLYLADRWETQGIDGLQSAFADYHGFAQRALSIRI